MNTYTLSEDGQSITCNLCGMRSYNRNDIEQKYCGRCHRFHEKLPEHIHKLLRPSLWRRYCNWLDALSWQAKTILLLGLGISAIFCAVDFIRKVIL